MRDLLWVGVVLIILGIGGLIVQTVTYTKTDTVARVGPLELRAEEQHRVPIPTIAGIVAVLAGAGLIFAARRRA